MPGTADRQKAKAQAQRLVSVKGTNCTLHVGAITFFRNEALEFFWRDPGPVAREPIEIPDPEPAWQAYYSPFVEIYKNFAGPTVSAEAQPLVSVEEMDLSIGMHPVVAPLLLEGNWQRAREAARHHREALTGYQTDGLLVQTGPSWQARLERPSTVA
jgi:hypothetical protein